MIKNLKVAWAWYRGLTPYQFIVLMLLVINLGAQCALYVWGGR